MFIDIKRFFCLKYHGMFKKTKNKKKTLLAGLWIWIYNIIAG